MKKVLAVVLTTVLMVSVLPTELFSITASAATLGTSGYYTYTVQDGEATIVEVDKSISDDAVIPSTLGGYPVVSIYENAFSRCSNLTSIIIPNNVTSIGYGAFEDCSRLTSIIIPDGVTNIGYNTFRGCSSLTSVTIPDSVTEICESAFSHCSSLTNITIPDSVTSIGVWAFGGCSSLTNITIPDSVTSIGEQAFHGTGDYNDNNNWDNGVLYISNNLIDAKSYVIGEYMIKQGTKCIADVAFCSLDKLTSIIIPDSVTSIGYHTFDGCDNLTNITIGNSVTSIGSDAFYGCDSLTNITIGNSVTSIGSDAFGGCDSLKNVYYRGTAEDKEKMDIKNGNYDLLNAKWHRMGEFTVKTEPTCTSEGVKEGTCETCGAKAEEKIPVSEHTYGEAVVTKEATETEAGIKTKTCTTCGEKVEEEIPMLGSTSAPSDNTIGVSGQSNEKPKDKDNATLFVMIAIGAVVLIGGAITTIILIKKKKSNIVE